MNNISSDTRHGRRMILVASANSQHIHALSLLLQRFEYEVSTATDAAQALEQAGKVRPSLIITDLVLPDMSGIDLLARLGQDRSAASVPVLFMIPPGDAAAESQCLHYGAAGCISKPVDAAELYRTVQAVLERKPRANIRIDARVPVSVNNVPVECPGGKCLIDLSDQGMYLPMSGPYPKGRIAVQLHIKDRTISAEGAVLYTRAEGTGRRREPGIGLKFVAIAPQDQDFIRKFIREEITKDVKKKPSDA